MVSSDSIPSSQPTQPREGKVGSGLYHSLLRPRGRPRNRNLPHLSLDPDAIDTFAFVRDGAGDNYTIGQEAMTITSRPKTVRKFLSLILAGIGAFMMIVDITLGASKRASGSLYVPAGLGLVVIGAALYFLRRKEEQAFRDVSGR